MVRAGTGCARHGDPDLGQGWIQTRWVRPRHRCRPDRRCAGVWNFHPLHQAQTGAVSPLGRRRWQPDYWCTDVAAPGRDLLPAASPSLKAWIAAILLAVLATAFALILYFRLISRVGGQKASTVTFLIPVFAIGWGAALLGEA